MSPKDGHLRLGSTVLGISFVGILGASVAILSREPDPFTMVGRHLWAGGLALAALSVVEVLIALIPLRRGERWAFWAAALPFVVVAIPILILDATYAHRERMVSTLAPQVLGLAVGIGGLMLSARGLFGSRSDDR